MGLALPPPSDFSEFTGHERKAKEDLSSAPRRTARKVALWACRGGEGMGTFPSPLRRASRGSNRLAQVSLPVYFRSAVQLVWLGPAPVRAVAGAS